MLSGSKTNNQLLVVEDDPLVTNILRAFLESAGFAVRTAASGKEMLHTLGQAPADLILLDLELPDEDGLVLARQIRQTSDVPIIIVTGRSSVEDRVVGLELGADDYITKPFEAQELVARINSVLRRSGRQKRKEKQKQTVDGLEIVPGEPVVTGRDGSTISLTRMESAILAALLRAHGSTLSRDQLLDACGAAEGGGSSRSVDVVVSRLRRKIERDPRDPRIIVTAQGLGYRMGTGRPEG